MENNKNTGWIWALVIVIVAIAIVLIVRHKNNTAVTPTAGDYSTAGGTAGDTNALTATEDTSAGSVDAAAAPAALLSYAQALAQYGSKRIQFDGVCQATPNTATWKNGTNIMLDNRSPMARSLHLGTMGDVAIKAWGFKIVNFSSSLLPNVITIDCGASQNVAQIEIQK